MTDEREIKLLISARLKGARDISAIGESIESLGKAIDKQAESAKRGESAYEGFKAAAEGLKAVQQELATRSDALREVDKLTKRIEAQGVAVDKASKKLADYEKTLGESRTAKQQEQVQKLNAAYEASTKRLALYQASLKEINGALQAAGVNTADLAGEQRKVLAAQELAGAAQKRLTQELVDYNDNVAKGKAATAAKAKQDKDAAAAAELFAVAERKAADATRARDQAQEAFNTKRSGRVGESVGADRAAQEQAAAAARARELAALRADIEGRSAGAARDTGLQKIADDAEAATRQFTTLARASAELRPRIVSLREAVDAITNPAAAARQTLAGVEKQIDELSKVINGSKGPVKDFSGQFKELAAAQKAIQGQASLIDDFRNQKAAVQAASKEFAAAKAQVLQYTAALRQGGDGAEKFVRPLAEAQTRLRVAAQALREQNTQARQTGAALAAAGINVANLGDAEARLINSTKQATAALGQLSQAAKLNGEAVSGKGLRLFNDEGRTTLSLVQRIRGEILALTAAYVGVQGAISFAASTLKASTLNEGLKNSIGFALGNDPQKIGDEMAYITGQADRLGVSLEQGAKGYVKFAASASKSGAPLKEVRFIFETLAETARTLSLSPDELNGLLLAVGQSFSKGKIQAEELRGQIGERLPGAFAFAQEALKKFFPNLDKALEKGQVGAEHLVVVMESVRRAAQDQLPQAIKSLDAEQQRFNNSVLKFKLQIAEAGFADAYVGLLKQLTEIMKSQDGKELAKNISDLASAMVKGISTIVQYRSEIGLVLQVFAAFIAGGLITKVGVSLTVFTGLASALAPVVFTLAGAFRALGVTVAAVFAGFQLGQRLRDEFQDVRLFGTYIAQFFAGLFAIVEAFAKDFAEAFPLAFENAFKKTINTITFFGRETLKLQGTLLKAVGLDTIGDSFKTFGQFLELKPADAGFKRVQALGKKLDEIGATFADMRKEELLFGGGPAKIGNQSFPSTGSTTPFPGSRAGIPGLSDSDKTKRENQIEAIRNALESLNASTLKSQNENLSSLLAAVDLQYADLARKIAELGGEDGKAFAEAFARGITSKKDEITKDFNAKLLKEQETLNAKLDELDAQAGRKNKDSLDARLGAIRISMKKVFDEINDAELNATRGITGEPGKQTDEIRATAEAARVRARIIQADLEALETKKVLNEQLRAQEQAINDLINTRAIALKKIQEDVKAGSITPGQGDSQSQDVVNQFQPQIVAATGVMRDFATANAAAFDPNRLAEFLLKLQEATNAGKALNAEFDKTQQIIDKGIGQGIDDALNAAYDSIGKLTQGTADWGDAFEAVGRSILQTLANILKELAQAILKEQILITLKAIAAAYGGGGFTGVGAQPYHSGGVVGRNPASTRSVPAAWFASAPRYHEGGMVGLAPNEVPAVLQKNEEVLSTTSPRNIMNGGAAAGGQQTTAQRFVLVDDRSRVAEAMNTPEGEAVTLVHIRKNIPTLRQLFKG